MKKLIGFLLVISSFAFAQNTENIGHSNGYILLDNGNTYTVRSYFDNSLVPLFKPQGYFTLPEEIEAAGSNFYIDDEDVLFTTDTNGWLYKKMEYLDDHRVSKAGGVFFITSKSGSQNRAAHIVMNNGLVVEHHADGFELFDSAYKMGGVYFMTRRSEFIIANPYDGKFYQTKDKIKLKRKHIVHYGHNYVLNKKGDLVVFGFVPRSVRNEDGSVGTKYAATIDQKDRNPEYTSLKVMGGNFFFNNKNEIITINDQGQVNNRGKIIISSIGKDKSNELPSVIGTNYFVYEDGEVYMIDKDGYFWFLTKLPYYERIGKSNFSYND
jgi:hypothetical protein